MNDSDMLEQARRLVAEADTEEGMAHIAAMRYASKGSGDGPVDRLLREVELRFREDPDLAARYRAACDRIAKIDATGDAVAHFERLTGQSLDPPVTPHGDRRPQPRPSRYRLRRSGLAGFGAVLLIGAFFVVGRMAEDPLAAGAFEDVVSAGPGQIFRGETDPHLEEARRQTALSRTTWMGVWTRYDAQTLAAAESLLGLAPTSEAAQHLAIRIKILAGDRVSALRLLGESEPGDSVAAALRERLMER